MGFAALLWQQGFRACAHMAYNFPPTKGLPRLLPHAMMHEKRFRKGWKIRPELRVSGMHPVIAAAGEHFVNSNVCRAIMREFCVRRVAWLIFILMVRGRSRRCSVPYVRRVEGGVALFSALVSRSDRSAVAETYLLGLGHHSTSVTIGPQISANGPLW
jgi:hypothetical protein